MWLASWVGGVLLTALGASGAVAAGGSGGGGTVFVAQPEVSKVSCFRRCATRHRAQGSSTLRIDGQELGDVATVVFHGTVGRSDDLRAKVRAGSSHRLQARPRR